MSKQSGEIRIVKRRKGGHGHHGGSWKVAYADFVTAMMAFFMVMWLINMTPDIKQAVAEYFKDPIAFGEAVKKAGKGGMVFAVTSDGQEPGSKDAAIEVSEEALERERLKKTKAALDKLVEATPELRRLKNHVEIKLTNEGMRIDLLESHQSLFFDSASSTIKPETRLLLKKIAVELAKLPNKVIIEGHTDNLPLNRRDGYTNWELSSDRAHSARKVLVVGGLGENRIAQVRGYADTRLRDPSRPWHFTNRRVSIVVVLNQVMKQEEFGNQIFEEKDQDNAEKGGSKPATNPLNFALPEGAFNSPAKERQEEKPFIDIKGSIGGH